MAKGQNDISTKLSLTEKLIAWLGVLGLLIWLLYQRLNADYWNDELYTLEHFVLPGLSHILFDYHVPNNHVFFNLLLNGHLKLLGSPELIQLLQYPCLLRLMPAIFLLFTMAVLYRAKHKIAGQRLALLSLLVLLSFLPMQNFALQLRAYGFSIFMLSVIYYALISYRLKPKLKYLVILVLSSCLAFYALPSNLYYILAALAFLIILALRSVIRSGVIRLEADLYRPILALIAGLGLAVLCYLPIFRAVFFNPYVSQADFFDFKTLKFHLLHLWEAFSYGLIPIFLLAGLALFFRLNQKMRLALGLALSFVFIPVLISFVRGDHAPPRVFIPASPFVAITLALFLEKLMRISALGPKFLSPTVFMLIPVFLVLNTVNRQAKYQEELKLKLSKNERPQGLLYQFYSAHYHPLKTVQFLDSIRGQKPLQVLVKGCEPHGIKHYLQAYRIEFVHDYYQPQGLDSLKHEGEPFYLISDQFEALNPSDIFEAEPLLKDQSYHNLFKVSLDDNLKQRVGQALAASPRISLETDSGHQFLLDQLRPEAVVEAETGTSAKARGLLLDLPLSPEGWMIDHLNTYQIDSISSEPKFRLIWLSALPADSSSSQLLSDTNLLNLDSENAFYELYGDRGFQQHHFFEFRASCTSPIEDPGVLSFQVDRNGENVHWQAWHWRDFKPAGEGGNIRIPLELDYDLKARDKWSFYLWAHKGDSVALRHVSFRSW